jgi:hypothetical protein
MINTVPKNAWNKVGLISSFQLLKCPRGLFLFFTDAIPVIASKNNTTNWKIQWKELRLALSASSHETSETLQSVQSASLYNIVPQNARKEIRFIWNIVMNCDFSPVLKVCINQNIVHVVTSPRGSCNTYLKGRSYEIVIWFIASCRSQAKA